MRKILIVGADHHNTLSVVRGIGKQYENYDILIPGNFKTPSDTMVSHSKYGKNKVFVCEHSDESMIDFLLKYNSDIDKKVVLLPCTDFDMFIIDKYWGKLKGYYIFPGFKNDGGKVSYLMDKYHQKEFATKNKIKMAETWHIHISKTIPDNIIYPCIIKPDISAYGSKTDVTICHNKNELKNAIEIYNLKKYKTAIIQRFLFKKFEICAFGTILEKGIYGCIVKKIREYPLQGGSTSYAEFMLNDKIERPVDKVLNTMKKEGYRGNYDVEFLVCDDGIYLNEINFRHSGNGYSLIKCGVNAPLYWCMEAMGAELPDIKVPKRRITLINDTADFRHVLEHRINIFEYLRAFVTANAHSVLDYDDLSGTFGYLKKAFGRYTG